MRVFAACLLLLVACRPAISAGSDAMTVGMLLDRCGSLRETHAPSVTADMRPDEYCLGLIDAYRDALMLSAELYRKAGVDKDWKSVLRVCIPGRQVSSVSLARIFVHWAGANRERITAPAIAGLHEALRQAYPCVDTYR